jgi:hypothetical protein
MMDLPPSLNVSGEIELYLPSSRTVTLTRAAPEFTLWKGPTAGPEMLPKDAIEFEGRAAAPELAVLWSFHSAGWGGVWINREGGGPPTGDPADSAPPELPPAAAELLDRIHRAARTTKGDWDLCCWRDARIVFSLVKRVRGDRFGAAQLFWLEAAFHAGLTHEHFLVVEWNYRSRSI